MTHKMQIPVILIALLLFTAIDSSAGENWKTIMDKDGITISTRPAEGCPLDQFRGITVVEASLETCTAVLRDVPSQPQWMGDCLEARIIKTFDKNHIVAYNVLNAPWPLSNRDLQVDTLFEEDYARGVVTVSMKVYAEELVPLGKYVRILDFQATCLLEKIDDTHTRVTYINRVNPMAPVPGAVANMFVRKNPYTTLRGLKKMVTMKKYQRP